MSAALAVQNAQILEQTARLIDRLQAGLKGRGLIDQAIGVLRRRTVIRPMKLLIDSKR